MNRLGDRFVLGEKIGSGGMSEVFLGTDEVLDRTVAIKVLRGGFEGSDVGARFSREGRTAARLSHPNVVQVYDAGEDELGGREVSYIVMEYVPGGDLKDMMDERGPLDERGLARIGAEVVAGLAHAHGRGIVHRDIKPQNILIDDYGHPKLTDFGIAKALDAATTTQTGSYLGTALYSSPEQLRGEPAAPKSDVYALGATLYYAVVGEPIFAGGPIQVASQQISRPPTPPRARGAEIGARMDDLIMRCLSKDPAARPETLELSAELLSISAEPVASKPSSASGSAAPLVGSVQAAGAAAIAGLARVTRTAGEKGTSVGGRERGGRSVSAEDPTRTVTIPTRTFRPGHERNRNMLLLVGALVLLFAILLVWSISALFANPETANTSNDASGSQQVDTGNQTGDGSGTNADAGDAGDSDTQSGKKDPKDDADKEEPKDRPENAGPPADPNAAEEAVYNMYVAAATNDYETSWNYLSDRYQKEFGSLEDWERRYEPMGGVSFAESLVGGTANGVTQVRFSAEESWPDGARTVSGRWVVIEEDGEPKLERLIRDGE